MSFSMAWRATISGAPVTASGPGWFENQVEMEIDLVVRGSRHFGQRLHLAVDAGVDWDDTLEVIDARLRSTASQTGAHRAATAEPCP